ncbi:MAG: methyltransferase domain-containing protein [Cryobacterium sp.]|nr:methyltransferase domain-containing protein [Oligoflexia bacterium]
MTLPTKLQCDYFARGECRSCSEIEVSLDAQIKEKESRVCEALSDLPISPGRRSEASEGSTNFPLLPTIRSQVSGFRNRAKMAVTGSLETPIIGLVGEGSSVDSLDQGREILDCPIHHPALNAIFNALPDFIRRFQLTPYRIKDRTGELKGLIAFHSPTRNETYLRFVLRSRECVSRIKKALPELRALFPNLVCVTVNLQPTPHAILEGEVEIVLTAENAITHEVGGIPFRLSPMAFVQTNVLTAEKLYRTAAEWIRDADVQDGMELYCGQGAFSFFTAPHVKRFLGVEINPDAVETANLSAKLLGYDHLSFVCLDARAGDEGMKQWMRERGRELVLVNPPRRGVGSGIELIEEVRPRNFIYSSCEIGSLSNDLRKLTGYQIERVQIFDLFPHTRHFETLVWLTTPVTP